MKKPSKKARIKEILEKANRKFAGRWVTADDVSYIFPVAEVVYTGKPGDEIPDDPERLPLAIRTTTFINELDIPLGMQSVVETRENTVIHDNPYAIEAGCNTRCIEKFLTKAEARKFVGKIRKRLAEEIRKLDRLKL
jgi:hypothetical protein